MPRGFALGALLLCACVMGAIASSPTRVAASPAVVATTARVKGWAWVYQQFAPDEAAWSEVVRGVRSGDRRWLEIAVDDARSERRRAA